MRPGRPTQGGLIPRILRQLSKKNLHIHYAFKLTIVTRLLAYKLDSLVRVSRRVGRNIGNKCRIMRECLEARTQQTLTRTCTRSCTAAKHPIAQARRATGSPAPSADTQPVYQLRPGFPQRSPRVASLKATRTKSNTASPGNQRET